MYLLQESFSLSDEGVEDAIYDFRCRASPGRDDAAALSASAGEHRLGEKLFEAQTRVFDEQGWIMRGGR